MGLFSKLALHCRRKGPSTREVSKLIAWRGPETPTHRSALLGTAWDRLTGGEVDTWGAQVNTADNTHPPL